MVVVVVVVVCGVAKLHLVVARIHTCVGSQTTHRLRVCLRTLSMRARGEEREYRPRTPRLLSEQEHGEHAPSQSPEKEHANGFWQPTQPCGCSWCITTWDEITKCRCTLIELPAIFPTIMPLVLPTRSPLWSHYVSNMSKSIPNLCPTPFPVNELRVVRQCSVIVRNNDAKNTSTCCVVFAVLLPLLLLPLLRVRIWVRK